MELLSPTQKRGLKRLISILNNADQKKFNKGLIIWRDNGGYLYCSIGIVAKELGYWKDGESHFKSAYDFVRHELNIPTVVTNEIINQNDNECESYKCVAKSIKEQFL